VDRIVKTADKQEGTLAGKMIKGGYHIKAQADYLRSSAKLPNNLLSMKERARVRGKR
jgi:hypothetical protein